MNDGAIKKKQIAKRAKHLADRLWNEGAQRTGRGAEQTEEEWGAVVECFQWAGIGERRHRQDMGMVGVDGKSSEVHALR